jgi:hypothetical protein
MTRFKLYLLVFLLFLTIRGFASSVSFLPLEQVISAETLILEAKVLETILTHHPQKIHLKIDVQLTNTLQGVLKEKIQTLVYEQIVPIMRDEKGKVVTHFSPILEASGIEFNLEKGKTYLFFTRVLKSHRGTLEIFRAEPLEQKTKVLDLLKALKKESNDLHGFAPLKTIDRMIEKKSLSEMNLRIARRSFASEPTLYRSLLEEVVAAS